MGERWLSLEEAARRSGRSVEEIRGAVILGETEGRPTADEAGYVVSEAEFPARAAARAPCRWGRLTVGVILLFAVAALYYFFIGPFRGRYVCAQCGAREQQWFTSMGGWKLWSKPSPSELHEFMATIDKTPCRAHDWRLLTGSGGTIG